MVGSSEMGPVTMRREMCEHKVLPSACGNAHGGGVAILEEAWGFLVEHTGIDGGEDGNGTCHAKDSKDDLHCCVGCYGGLGGRIERALIAV